MLDRFIEKLDHSLNARLEWLDDKHETAFRLFNGYLEGYPTLVIDLYARTAVIYNGAEPPGDGDQLVAIARRWLGEQLPWITCVIIKERNGVTNEARRGRVFHGGQPVRKIRENGIWYALELCMNQDASFYLDTRYVRQWATENLVGKTVLNTFAYTGSLGVAAAGRAERVVHTDLNRRFLNVAKTSYTLNGFPIEKKNFQVGDFFAQVNKFKRANERFDCIILDPPFFSTTDLGTIDLANDTARLINKVRPLVSNGGQIVFINNALYLSGQTYMRALESLCEDGYVQIDALLPVSSDVTGYTSTITDSSVTDSSPFNHSTKIAILRIYHDH